MLVLSLYPHDIKPEMIPNVFRAIKEKWPRMSNVLLQHTRPDRPRDADLWDRCRELVKDVIPSVRVPNHIVHGGPPTATGGWTVEQVKHWQQVASIIEAPAEEKPLLGQLMLLLSESQRGLAQGLPVAELAEVHEEWRRLYAPMARRTRARATVRASRRARAK